MTGHDGALPEGDRRSTRSRRGSRDALSCRRGAFAGGFVGVDVFFVISGYLITSVILAERQAGTFTLAGFYERRAPPHPSGAAARRSRMRPGGMAVAAAAGAEILLQSLAATGLMSSNVWFWLRTGYFSESAELSPLLHTWSLGVEEQYYVLFPALLLLLLRLGKRSALLATAVAALAGLALATWGSVHHPAAAFYLLPTRAWELLVGVLLALLAAGSDRPAAPSGAWHEVCGLAGLLLIATAALSFDRQIPFPGIYAIVPVAGAALVIRSAGPDTIAGRMLGARPLVAMGLLSYGAYLWHQPLLAFARYRNISEPAVGFLAGLCAMAFLLAYASWRLVEVPARDRTRRHAAIVLPFLAVATILVVGLGAAGTLAEGFPARETAEEAALRELGPRYVSAIFKTGCDSNRDELPRCRGGAPARGCRSRSGATVTRRCSPRSSTWRCALPSAALSATPRTAARPRSG
jgi:peptidoglycan/LPS O-acetylase OafA/YrhL